MGFGTLSHLILTLYQVNVSVILTAHGTEAQKS